MPVFGNTVIEGQLSLLAQPAVELTLTQQFAVNGETIVTWGTAVEDPLHLWDGAFAIRLSGIRIMSIVAQVLFSAAVANNGTFRRLFVQQSRNSVEVRRLDLVVPPVALASALQQPLIVSGVLNVTDGDVLAVFVNHDSIEELSLIQVVPGVTPRPTFIRCQIIG